MLRPLHWLRAIHRHRAEVTPRRTLPTTSAWSAFRPEEMEGVDLSNWKVTVNGAEPVRAATLKRFAETFAPYGFRAETMNPSYGLAEATLLVTSGSRGAPLTKRTVSMSGLQRGIIREPEGAKDAYESIGCGFAVDSVSIAIVNPDTSVRTRPEEIGEIWVRASSSVAKGYWHRPEESQRTFRARIQSGATTDTVEEGEWLRTGDLGHLGSDGDLHVVGRIKDVVIVRGVNHYPQDIEMTVADSHPALRRDHGAVFGFVGDDGIERVVAVQEVSRSQRKAESRENPRSGARRRHSEPRPSIPRDCARAARLDPQNHQRQDTTQPHPAALAKPFAIALDWSGACRSARHGCVLSIMRGNNGSLHMSTTDDMISVCQLVLADMLRMSPADIRPSDTFAGLGLDSAAAVHFVLHVEQKTGLEFEPGVTEEYPPSKLSLASLPVA